MFFQQVLHKLCISFTSFTEFARRGGAGELCALGDLNARATWQNRRTWHAWNARRTERACMATGIAVRGVGATCQAAHPRLMCRLPPLFAGELRDSAGKDLGETTVVRPGPALSCALPARERLNPSAPYFSRITRIIRAITFFMQHSYRS